MSDLQKVTAALNEYRSNPTEYYILSNLCMEITSKKAFEKLWSEIRPFPDEFYENPHLVISILSGCVKSGVNIQKNDFHYVEEWIDGGLEGKIEVGRSSLCVSVAMLFSPNANNFSDDPQQNARFADEDRAKSWIQKAVNLVENVDACLYIISSVAAPYQGLHVNDKQWGGELVDEMSPKLTEKDAKKLKKEAKKIISGS